MRTAASLQLLICGAALAFCLLAPRQGDDVLLVPIGEASAGTVFGQAGSPLRLIGPGGLRGSLIARAAGPVSFDTILRMGILPLSISPGRYLCGDADARQRNFG